MFDTSAYRGYLSIVLINLTALGVLVWQIRDPRATSVLVEPAPTTTPAPTATEIRLHIYVSGAVATPGVVQLAEGARAREAVAAAGGFAREADREAVNLASLLADGQQLHVPEEGEVSGPSAGISGQGSASPAVGAVAPGAQTGAGSGDKVNVNRASAAELEALPGVGPALASRIVAHRSENGPFQSVEALLAVSGIGEKTLARFKDQVTLR